MTIEKTPGKALSVQKTANAVCTSPSENCELFVTFVALHFHGNGI